MCIRDRGNVNGMEKQEERKSSLLDGWNAPPNLVTFSRIILVIVFLALYAKAGAWGVDNVTMRWVAAVIFIIAACTDKLDGWMARKYNQVTELGKLMDPIADKLLTCGTLIVAAIFNEFGNPVLGWVVTCLLYTSRNGPAIPSWSASSAESCFSPQAPSNNTASFTPDRRDGPASSPLYTSS